MRFGGSVLRLILAGIAVSALFSAGVGALKYMADPLSQLPEITFWLLGGLASITWLQFWSIAPVVSISVFVVYRMRWRLNILSLDDSTAFSLGAAPGRERAVLLGAGVAATAAVVSVCGMVGWLGLIVPTLRGASSVQMRVTPFRRRCSSVGSSACCATTSPGRFWQAKFRSAS